MGNLVVGDIILKLNGIDMIREIENNFKILIFFDNFKNPSTVKSREATGDLIIERQKRS